MTKPDRSGGPYSIRTTRCGRESGGLEGGKEQETRTRPTRPWERHQKEVICPKSGATVGKKGKPTQALAGEKIISSAKRQRGGETWPLKTHPPKPPNNNPKSKKPEGGGWSGFTQKDCINIIRNVTKLGGDPRRRHQKTEEGGGWGRLHRTLASLPRNRGGGRERG